MERFALVLLISCAVLYSAQIGLLSYPLHASCTVDWTFELPCKNCSDHIIAQMGFWKGDNCSGTEKCKYEITSFNPETLELKGTHTTPVKHYVDDLTFTFIANGSECSVKGFSYARTWFAVTDYGTNYCNLHNLITGSGLSNDNYTESTSDSECTQYSSANCDKY